MKRRAAASAILLAGCLWPAVPESERCKQTEALLRSASVPVIFEAQAPFAIVTVADALSFSSGFDQGEALRTRLGLEAPAAGFARAWVEELREQPRLTDVKFRISARGDAQADLIALGNAPVLFASVAGWRLLYDRSLSHYRLVLDLQAAIVPASQVVAGRGQMALPQRLWHAICRFRGPDPPPAMASWLAADGAMLRSQLAEAEQHCARQVSEELKQFLERRGNAH